MDPQSTPRGRTRTPPGSGHRGRADRQEYADEKGYRIFREYVHEGRSGNNIATRLNDEGYPSPGGRGKPWRYDTIKVIPENPACAGDFAAGRYSYGKYHTISQGKVGKAKGRASKPESEWVVRRDHHDALVDRDTWEKAQVILAKGKTGRSPHTPENNPFVLSGLLRCGKCSCPLNGVTTGRNGHRFYECRNRRYHGSGSCEGATVREDAVLRDIADYLDNWLGDSVDALGGAAYYGVLAPDSLPDWFPVKAFNGIKNLLTPPERPKVDRDRLQKAAQKLKADIARARGNLVLLDPSNIPEAQERIRLMDGELADTEKELKESQGPAE